VADRHFTFAYTFAKERRIGYRKGPGRAGGKLTRSILLNRSTIPKGRRVEVEVEERECSGGENERECSGGENEGERRTV
jgi:hypothetical protein